jgi:hypothetical protein
MPIVYYCSIIDYLPSCYISKDSLRVTGERAWEIVSEFKSCTRQKQVSSVPFFFTSTLMVFDGLGTPSVNECLGILVFDLDCLGRRLNHVGIESGHWTGVKVPVNPGSGSWCRVSPSLASKGRGLGPASSLRLLITTSHVKPPPSNVDAGD